MLKISEKPCDFVIEDTSSVKFFSHSSPFLPLWRGTGGRASFAPLRWAEPLRKKLDRMKSSGYKDITSDNDFCNSSPQRRKERKGIIFFLETKG